MFILTASTTNLSIWLQDQRVNRPQIRLAVLAAAMQH
jgi:hypothetical protein